VLTCNIKTRLTRIIAPRQIKTYALLLRQILFYSLAPIEVPTGSQVPDKFEITQTRFVL
jgi:hypothetical protein